MLGQTNSLYRRVTIVGLTTVCEERLQPMPWKPSNAYGNDHIERYNQALEQLANEYGAVFVALDDVFADQEADYLPDGIHPNAAGHSLIYERVKGALEQEEIL